MSIKEVKVPQLSESVAEATLLQWKKQPGQAVAADEILIEIETDKVVLEVPAPAAGVLTEIIKADGSTVVSDELIAKIDTEAKAGAAAPAASATAAAPAQAAPAAAAPAAQKTTGTVAMPSAAKLMAETGVSVSQGTGKDGRVTKGDVIAAASAPKATVASSLPAAPSAASSLPAVPVNLGPEAMLEGRPEQRVPMSRLRARVAERLLQSQATNAILTTFNEVNMAPLMAMRKQYVERFEKEHGVKLGFMSFFVKAAVAA
ncbi:MAG: biotin/lipoyl-containing protein, partial [Burkholderiaceae bacterium]